MSNLFLSFILLLAVSQSVNQEYATIHFRVNVRAGVAKKFTDFRADIDPENLALPTRDSLGRTQKLMVYSCTNKEETIAVNLVRELSKFDVIIDVGKKDEAKDIWPEEVSGMFQSLIPQQLAMAHLGIHQADFFVIYADLAKSSFNVDPAATTIFLSCHTYWKDAVRSTT